MTIISAPVLISTSIIHFFVWFYFGYHKVCSTDSSINEISASNEVLVKSRKGLFNGSPSPHALALSVCDAKEFDRFRAAQYVAYKNTLFDSTLIINPYGKASIPCTSYSSVYVQSKDQCIAISAVRKASAPYNLLRYDANSKIHHQEREEIFHLPKSTILPIGFFLKVNRAKGRMRMKQKFDPFLRHYEDLMALVSSTLLFKGFKPGSNIVLMTLNDGELDLFLNYACSCVAHNISIANTIVFSGSPEVVPFIQAAGAMAVSHPGFSEVSRAASEDYIDYIFVDMMWFKAMSLFVMVHLGYNVLFQDVDWVMFRDVFPLLEATIKAFQAAHPEGLEPDILFSDDGNLSLRYAPFFANSGFYFMKSNAKTEQLTWSVMESMDYIQRLGNKLLDTFRRYFLIVFFFFLTDYCVKEIKLPLFLGSHQNVLTMRMMELTDLFNLRSKIIPLDDLPNGILYHHDLDFMKRMFQKKISPYGFHM